MSYQFSYLMSFTKLMQRVKHDCHIDVNYIYRSEATAARMSDSVVRLISSLAVGGARLRTFPPFSVPGGGGSNSIKLGLGQ